MFFSFARTENQSWGVVQVSLQEGSELALDLNDCLDPVFMPFEATWENDLDEPEFIFWSSGDWRNWWGTRGGNWSLQLEGWDSATLGSGFDIALLRAIALVEGATNDFAWGESLGAGLEANGPGWVDWARLMGIGFKEPMLGFSFRVGPVLTFLPKLFLFPQMGITLLPVAAGVSLSPEEPAEPKTNLPEGILRVERVVKQLLEAVEDCIFQKKGGFGGVWFGLVSVKNVLDYHAHREFSTPLSDIEWYLISGV